MQEGPLGKLPRVGSSWVEHIGIDKSFDDDDRPTIPRKRMDVKSERLLSYAFHIYRPSFPIISPSFVSFPFCSALDNNMVRFIG